MAPMNKRERAWSRLSTDLDMKKLNEMVVETTLEEVPTFAEAILAGQVRGRVVVNIS